MSQSSWKAVSLFSGSQGGWITRNQALGAGYSPGAFARLVKARSMTPLDRGVYSLRSGQEFLHRDLQGMLLCCGPGAILSHRSAAKVHGLWGVDGFPLEVTLPSRFSPPPMVTVHRGVLPTVDLCKVDGLEVTTVARTLLDVAGTLDAVQLASMLESARRKDPRLLATLRGRLHELSQERARTVEALLDDCQGRSRPMDSPFEVQFWHRWRYTGLPLPTPQFEVRDRSGRMFIDFAWPEQKVAVETMGYERRGTRESFNYDSRRMLRLVALGWTVLPITYDMFCQDFFGAVTDSVRRPLTARRSVR